MDDDILNSAQLELERMRISALTKAVEISPFVKEVTIGPNSPKNKQINYPEDPTTKRPESKNDMKVTANDSVSREEQIYLTMLHDKESQLRSNVDTIFRSLLDNMVTKRLETMEKIWKRQSEENERKSREMKNKLLNMINEINQESVSLLEEARNNEKNCTAVNRKTIETMNRILEEQNQSASRFAAITDSHTKVCISYNDILQALLDKSTKGVRDKYSTTLNTIITNMNNIMEICKKGDITDKEVKQAEVLAKNMGNVKDKILDEIQKLEQHKTEVAEKLKAENKLHEPQPVIENAAETKTYESSQALATKNKSKPLFFSESSLRNHKDLINFLQSYENTFKDLLDNVNLKKYKFDCQKAVNTPVNTLSSLNGMQIRDKYDKLLKLLKGDNLQVQDTMISTTQHPQALNYCTALLAKKIVRQGDLLVSCNPQAAFPLAAVTVALWAQFPDLGKLIEANFQSECPYLVPMFLPQQKGQTDKEFYISRGYTYDSDGIIEKHDKFLKRMSGVFKLCCAIWISQTPKFINSPNPHGLRFAWRWLAAFINLKPEPDISATLLYDFFSICGSECLKCYGKQFTKIIKLICTDYLKILDNIDEGGPKTRLEEFLKNVLETGSIPAPVGVLSSNIW